MSWKPFIVGVDGSPEAAWAAGLAAEAAQSAGTTCHLVHATRDALSALAQAELPERAQELGESLIAAARERIAHSLWGVVAPELVQQMTIRAGRAAVVLREVVAERGAGLIVLGGKHHSVLGRWLAGSTSVDVVRTAEVPVLVTGSGRAPPRRILATVDLSAAAQPTIEAAERVAELFQSELRVMSVLEPLPIVPEAPNYDLTHYYAMLEDHLRQRVWPLVQSPRAQMVTRYGMPVETIIQEAAAWPADLLVVGSHGKGWVDRLLIGSVTEGLLNHLPTAMLVVPVHAPVAAREPERARARKAEPSMAHLPG